MPTLRRRLETARVELAEQPTAFDEFSREQGDRVAGWKKLVDDFEADPTKTNPYEVKVKGESLFVWIDPWLTLS